MALRVPTAPTGVGEQWRGPADPVPPVAPVRRPTDDADPTLAVLRRRRPGRVSRRPAVPTVDAGQTLGQAAFAVLRRQFDAFLSREAGTRRGRDPEALHQMRVATRRLRAAMALFRDVLPAAAVRLREELAWIGGCLGAVRDLDVQLAEAKSWLAAADRWDRQALLPFLDLLGQQRARAREEMLRAMDSPRYPRLVAAYGALLDRGPLRRPAAAGTPAPAAAPDLIRRRHRAARKAAARIGPASPPPRYHVVRIKAKRLRYAVEFFGDLYGDAAWQYAKRVTELQDLLGRLQDAHVAVRRLRALRRTHARRLPPRTLFVMGQAAQRYAGQEAAARAEFPRVAAGLSGKRWKRLEREMEAARPAAPQEP